MFVHGLLLLLVVTDAGFVFLCDVAALVAEYVDADVQCVVDMCFCCC